MPANIVLRKKERAIKKLILLFWLWAPVVLWMTVIFYLSSIPGDQTPFVDIPNIDKFFHSVEYFILGALLVRAFSKSVPIPNYKYILIASVLIAALYGASDEFHQLFVQGRNCDIIDLSVDIIGACIGIALGIYKERIDSAIDKTV